MKQLIVLLSTLLATGHTPLSFAPKGAEIVNVVDAYVELGKIERTRIKNIDIEVLAISEMPKGNGIEVHARAWDRNGEQIGFGKNGDVDIERFRIINPPGLTTNLEVDYKQSLLESMEHTIHVKKEKAGSRNIRSGKIGSTTTTLYPDGGSTTEDGVMLFNSALSWDDAHDATSATSTNDDSDPQDSCGKTEVGGMLFFVQIDRFGLTFPSPDIGSATISSVTVSLYGISVTNEDNDGDDYLVATSFAPASNSSFAAADYNDFGSTAYSGTIDFGSLSTSAYNDFSLNATGIAAIENEAINPIGFREGHDMIDSPIGGGLENEFTCSTSEHTGTTQDPKMVIEHDGDGGSGGGGSPPPGLGIFF